MYGTTSEPIHENNLNQLGGRNVRKVIIALMISAVVIMSGISATTFTSGQFISIASADGGDGG
jgi:hypothetical protein